QLDDRSQARIVRRQRAQAARHGAELRQRRALGLGQRLERRLRAREKARAVLQEAVLGGDALPFSLHRGNSFHFSAPVLDLRTLGLPRRVVLLRLGRYGLEPLPVAIGVPGVRAERLRPGLRIEQLALRGGAQQRLVQVLAVNVDQVFAGLFQL